MNVVPSWFKVVALSVLFNAGTPIASSEAASPSSEDTIRIVAFGDSLTEGYRLPRKQAFPAKLEAALRDKGHAVEVVNAGVSGDTTAAGLARMAWAVPDGTNAVILELGANDALRGLPPKATRANLDKILTSFDQRGIPVLLAGMRAPRNWGDGYSAEFDAIFPELAKKYDALLYPFFLDGVALDAGLNLDDGLHPNTRGVDKVVAGILPSVEDLILRVKQRRQPGNRS